MNSYKVTWNTWNKIAHLYQDKFMDLALYNDTYNKFLKQLNLKYSSVLDVGCGPGNISSYLFSQRPDLNITAIDVAPNMITLARQHNPYADCFVLKASEISTLNTCFNGIIAGFVLPYLSLSDCITFFKDCKHILSPTGVLYFSFVEGPTERSGFQTGKTGDQMFFYYHNLETLLLELEKLEFKLISVDYVTYHLPADKEEIHTVVIAQK
ncbi:class I SAM-dependent DNA methyltransferase [Formosa sp. S-31]|uniref:class I SAM-dependent DNA methyltransferase n=1 Tax=Formosa sp. S-31 TaxID=2790949 RepID=UPI003EBBB397